MVPLAVTSTAYMIRRLGRRWQTLHRLVYVSAVLAIVHFAWLVKKDLREPMYFGALLLALFLARSVTRLLPRRGATADRPAAAPDRTEQAGT
jgi:sulfoxide reductase heme-binding subunit YedZ